MRPDVLICAGLDPSGGAGLIADVRVIADLGARPNGIVTALTIQNTTGVSEWHATDREVVATQLSFLLSDIEMRAVKLGMIGSLAVAKAIGEALNATSAPLVWDPVGGPTVGDAFHQSFEEAVAALRPHLTLITPNTRELALLAQLPVDDHASAEAAGRALAHTLDTAVLVKGGHLEGDEAIDVLIHGTTRHEFRGPRIATESVHGTGCALSSAIAAYLALGRDLVVACRDAKQYVAERIANPARPGRGAPAVL
ncbi:bifunctional hydroxymethylpyrimidine kinase/phosphomethylpyrimidine kinase [soil metagenome]